MSNGNNPKMSLKRPWKIVLFYTTQNVVPQSGQCRSTLGSGPAMGRYG